MIPEEIAETNSDSSTKEPAKKGWRPPELRKLPIGATAQGKPQVGHDDGMTAKSGTAGAFS
jgi:hypothetical protein